MRASRTTAAIGALAAGAALAISGCGGDDGGGSAEGAKEIVVGTIMPLTGPQEALSNSYDGMRAAFAQVNDAGGIDGRRIRVVVRDDQFDAAKTPGAAREVVEGEDAVMLCSNQGSGGLKAIAPYLKARGIGSVAQSGEPELFPRDSTAFQMLTPYQRVGAYLVDYFVEQQGAKRIAIAYTDDGIGLPMKEGVERQLQRRGMKPVAAVKFNATSADQAPAAARLKASNADVVIVNHVAPVVGQLARATNRVGYRPKWGLSFAAQNKQVAELGGSSLAENAVFATPFPLSDDPSLAEYRAQMKQRYPRTDATDFLTIEGFAAGKVCAGVLQKASEAAGGSAPSREQVLQALREYTLDEAPVRGLDWSTDHTGPAGLQLVRFAGDDFEQVADFSQSPEVPVEPDN